MKIIGKRHCIAALVGALSLTSAYAQTPTPGYNQKIPEKIMTPDTVETRIGTLNFVDGVPTDETAQKVYDNLDFLRGVEVFLNFIPAASLEAIRLGNAEIGATKSNQALIFDHLMDSNPLFLTGNTDTVYCMVMLDLETDRPTVVEVPPTTKESCRRTKGRGRILRCTIPVLCELAGPSWVPGRWQARRGFEDVPRGNQSLSTQ